MNLPGASELATIAGVPRLRRDGTPYLSLFTLWARLAGRIGRYDDGESGPDAEAGNDMEPGLGLRWSRLRGLPVVPGPHIPDPGFSHPDLPWAARPDFLSLDRTLEVKAPREFDEEWGPDHGDIMPAYYAVQVIGQVAVAARLWGWDRGELFARARAARWNARTQAEYTIWHDEQCEKRLAAKVRRFLEEHVETGRPPMVDGSESTTETLARIFRPDDTTVQATAEDLERWRRLVAVRSALDELTAQRRELEQELQVRMGAATVLEHGDTRLATWRGKSGANRIDIHRLRRERPDIATAYAETGSSGRAFTIDRR